MSKWARTSSRSRTVGCAVTKKLPGRPTTFPVETDIENDQEVEVSGAGLKPGVLAILNHSALLQPGTPVQTMPPPGAGPPQGAAHK